VLLGVPPCVEQLIGHDWKRPDSDD
jgi:hypothetical protein